MKTSTIVFRNCMLSTDTVYQIPDIKHILHSEKKGQHSVTVVFADGSHVTKKCLPEDTFDLNVGVALCLADKLIGSTTRYHKMIQKYLAPNKKKKKSEESKVEQSAATHKSKVVNSSEHKCEAVDLE